jgi:hypothetical protein
MTITSVETLIFFVCGFGIFGCARGPEREVWTLGGITMTMLLLFFGGTSVFEQLPLRVGAGLLAMIGNQSGSNSLVAHPLQAPWTTVMLVIGTAGLVLLAYTVGQKFGKSPSTKRDFGSLASGFVMGALNGTFICVFLFSQGGFQAGINIQFPDGGLTRTSIVPLILGGIVVTLIAVGLSSRRPKATGTP